MFETSFQAEPKNENNRFCNNLTADEKAKQSRQVDETNAPRIMVSSACDNTKQSRQTQTNFIHQKPKYIRSASVGTTTPKQNEDTVKFSQAASQNVVMSPRSQLRHVRQNLKKVNPSKIKENRAYSNDKLNDKAVNLRFQEKDCDRNLTSNEQVKLRRSKPQRPRPFSVIENINQFELGKSVFYERNKSTDKKVSTPSEYAATNQGMNELITRLALTYFLGFCLPLLSDMYSII